MKPRQILTHKFVEFVPEELEQNVLYISIQYTTAVHRCFCGCGLEVVTPFSPTDWKLIFDGNTVSLDPSIGNWSFPCRSHYWITRSQVSWAETWSDDEIEAGRNSDRLRKKNELSVERSPNPPSTEGDGHPNDNAKEGLWGKLKRKVKRSSKPSKQSRAESH